MMLAGLLPGAILSSCFGGLTLAGVLPKLRPNHVSEKSN